MAITTAICTSYKKELMTATHDHTVTTGHTFKMALYTSSATLSAATTAYSATNEVSGTGYTAGGAIMTTSATMPTTSGTTAYTDYADVVWNTATITARGCEIYNSSASNKAVQVHNFGADKSSTAANFTVQMPTDNATEAITRLA